MAGRSENGQFDIVSQAEDVVRAYIDRYFSYDNKSRKKRKSYDRLEKRLIFMAVISSFVLVALIAMLFLWF